MTRTFNIVEEASYVCMYNTATLMLVFTQRCQSTEQHFIPCVVKALQKPKRQHFNPNTLPISITFLPNDALTNTLLQSALMIMMLSTSQFNIHYNLPSLSLQLCGSYIVLPGI